MMSSNARAGEGLDLDRAGRPRDEGLGVGCSK